MLEETESYQSEAQKETSILELANRALHSKWDNILQEAEAKEVRLQERIGELGKENSELHEWLAVLEAENAQFLMRPSTSHASKYTNIPKEQYKDWILAEARIDTICDLNKKGFVYETAIEEARVKAREIWLAYDYDLAMPQLNSEGGDENGVDHLVDRAWYDSAYGRGEE